MVPWFVFAFASCTNHQMACERIEIARQAGRRTMPNCSTTCAEREWARVAGWPRFASPSDSRGRGMSVAIISIAVAILLGRDLLAQSAPAATRVPDDRASASDGVADTSRTVAPQSPELLARASLAMPAYSQPGISNALRPDTAAADTLEARVGRRILLGMAIGAAAGAGIGYVWSNSTCHDQAEGPSCAFANGINTLWCGVAGFFIGGVVGAFVHREAPPPTAPHVSIGAAPLGGGNAMFVVQIR